MPSGEETQEVPQQEEGRDQSEEIREQDAAAQRELEKAAEGEPLVEEIRAPVESEAIEAEVIEAVDAIPEDRMDQTAAAEEVSATPITLPDPPKDQGDEVSATPITLPDPPKDAGDEVSATPITLPDPPKDQGDEVSATPITLPDPPKDAGDEVSATPITLPDPPKDQGDEVSATPITLPDPPKDAGGEVSATPITLPDLPRDEILATPLTGDGAADGEFDETSFKVESPSPDWEEDPPRPPQGTMEEGRSETEDSEESRSEDEDVILDEGSFKPVPAQEGATLSPDDVKLDDGRPVTGEREQSPTEPILEKELPESGQLQEGLDQREDLQDMMDKDLDSFIPGGGEIVGADGKKVGGSKFGDDVRGLPGMDSGGKIDGSSEDPSGDQFAGKGMFKPGKGPGGGETEGGGPGKNYTYTEDEVNVMELITSGASEEKIAAKEKQLQGKALDEYQLVYTNPSDTPPGEQKEDKEDPPKPKPKKTSSESTPEEGGGSDVKAVTAAELDAVLDEVDGSQISTQDPDDLSGEVPDRMTPEGAKRVKDAMDMAASSKGKQKKAGSEVVTDPDQEDQDDKGGGRLGKKLGL